MTQPPFISMLATLRALACATCGVAFAVPAELHAERAKSSGSIVCPNGHANALAPADAAAPPTVQLIAGAAGNVETTAKQQSRERAEAAEAARRTISKRASVLARRCEQQGRHRVCSICGASIYFNAIESHYRKQHAAEVLAMPAEAFNQP